MLKYFYSWVQFFVYFTHLCLLHSGIFFLRQFNFYKRVQLQHRVMLISYILYHQWDGLLRNKQGSFLLSANVPSEPLICELQETQSCRHENWGFKRSRERALLHLSSSCCRFIFLHVVSSWTQMDVYVLIQSFLTF